MMVKDPQTSIRAAGGISLFRNDKSRKMTMKISLEKPGHTACPVKASPLFTDRNYMVTCS